jgi:hypothetical protein
VGAYVQQQVVFLLHHAEQQHAIPLIDSQGVQLLLDLLQHRAWLVLKFRKTDLLSHVASYLSGEMVLPAKI